MTPITVQWYWIAPVNFIRPNQPVDDGITYWPVLGSIKGS